MSYLGHEISKLARKHNILPVISAGNQSMQGDVKISPPADSEAALSVGGCKHDESGNPSLPCDISRQGPGPCGILKPEVTWFSTVRLLGGNVGTATSWATPLISSLAAHTFQNLREPTPDMVKALIINKTSKNEYNPQMGWGTPKSDALPWSCNDNSVTLAWTSELKPGSRYYWDDIPIPPSLIKNQKLSGKGTLTAIINPHPLVSELSEENYFSARIETNVQYSNKKGKYQSLLGGLDVELIPEDEARAEGFKWNPIRNHARDFSRQGLAFSGSTMRLGARIYVRDLYQYGIMSNAEAPSFTVSFVLTLEGDGNLYNEMRNGLGNFVESALIETDIEVDGF